jgi:hypothetical protein
VTKAVGEMLPPPSVWEGFRAVRKTGDGWSEAHVDGRNIVVPAHLQHVVPPQLLESYCGFNLVRFGNYIIAVRESLGEIPWTEGYDRLRARFGLDDFLTAPSVYDLKQNIDRVIKTQKSRRR